MAANDIDSTPGHDGPRKGLSSMNDALKNYFRGKKDPRQAQNDKRFTRKRQMKPPAKKKIAKRAPRRK